LNQDFCTLEDTGLNNCYIVFTVFGLNAIVILLLLYFSAQLCCIYSASA